MVSAWRGGDIICCCGVGSPSSMFGSLMQNFIILLEVTAAPPVLDVQILLTLQMMQLLIYFEEAAAQVLSRR